MCRLTWTSRKTVGLLLALSALASMAAWQVEMALRGPNEPWTRYFHWSLPLGVLLLTGWAVAVNPALGRARRAWLALFLVLVSLLCSLLMGLAVNNLYRGGVLFFEKTWSRRLADLALVAAAMLIPVYYASLAWLVGLRTAWPRLAVSLGLFWSALPVGMLLADLLGPQGPAGLVQAIKSGYGIPLVVAALGVLFLPPAEK